MGSSILNNCSATGSAPLHPRGLVSAALCAALWLGCGLLSPSATHSAQVTNQQLPISLDAVSSDFDYRKNVLVFRKVRISQGELSVEAVKATATGLDFKDSQWTFTGAVRIQVPNGLLVSDSATVNFANDQIAEAKITGAPARFEQRRKNSPKVTRGQAGLIEYNVEGGIVKLSNDAWLTDGASEITGQTLVYNIRDERVIANPGETDRQGVSITIRPGAKPIIKNDSKTEPKTELKNEPKNEPKTEPKSEPRNEPKNELGAASAAGPSGSSASAP